MGNSIWMSIILVLLGISVHSGVSLPQKSENPEESTNHHIRCQISESICSFSCLLGGHQSGVCVPNKNGGKACVCIEGAVSESICLSNNEKNLAGYTCAGYCQVIGRQTGECINEACECSRERFHLSRDYLCVANEVCSMHCQIIRGARNGKCSGPNDWDCHCEYGLPEEESLGFNSTESR